jgi:hypothetical protein
MSESTESPRSIEQRLLDEPRRTAGLDSERTPVRLGEGDASGHLAGYIDESGLAWESLTEQLVATHGGRLAEALRLPDEDRRRDELFEQLLAHLPDELLGPVVREAAGLLALRAFSGFGPTPYQPPRMGRPGEP